MIMSKPPRQRCHPFCNVKSLALSYVSGFGGDPFHVFSNASQMMAYDRCYICISFMSRFVNPRSGIVLGFCPIYIYIYVYMYIYIYICVCVLPKMASPQP